MPPRVAIKEYDVLRQLEDMELPAVRPAGLVLQPEFDTAILVTRYLEGLGSTAGCSCVCRLTSRGKRTAAGCDGGPVGGTASPRCLLGRLFIGEHLVLAGRAASSGLAGRRRDV